MLKESDPDYQRWSPQIRKELASIKGNVILAGHSLGASFKNLT
jgi:predicted alpha/beta hydrolase family esterase